MLQTFVAWATENQGVITTVATMIMALTSLATVWLTITLNRENKLLRKAGTEPEVVAYLLIDQRYKNVLNLVVANIGQGPARNVRFHFEADAADFSAHDVQLAATGDRPAIGLLPQGERISAFFGTGPDLFKPPQLRPFKIRVEFEDLRGRRRSAKFDLDIAEFHGLVTLGSTAEHEMAEALKTIAETVRGWSGIRRLKVETITTEEVARREREAREARQARGRESAPPTGGESPPST